MPQFQSLPRPARSLACAVVLLLLAAPPAQAQFERSQISGVVMDSTGAVLPGVTVTATNLQTQAARTPSPTVPATTPSRACSLDATI